MATVHHYFITVISGLPRSGTSMMMRALEAGGMPILTDNVRQADEDNPNGYYEFEAVKHLSRDASWLDDAYGKAVKIVYLLLYELPRNHRYHVIFMQRNLKEVIASQDVMLRRHDKQASTLESAQLAKLFQSQLYELSRWASAQEHIKLLYVDYNAVLRDPNGAMFEVDQFVGGGLDRDAMARIVDAALYRQRQ